MAEVCSFVYLSRILRSADRAIVRLSAVCMHIAVFCLASILAIGTVNVVALNLFKVAVPAILELSEVLLAVCIFFGFAYLQNKDRHLRLDVICELAPSMLKWLSRTIGLFLGAILFTVLTWQSWNLAFSSWRVGETANAILAFPIYPAKFMIAFGAGVAALEFLRQLAWSFRRLYPVRHSGDIDPEDSG